MTANVTAPRSDEGAAYRARRHFGSLDGLRAVAVIAVVWHHTVVANTSIPLSGRGFLGVDLFFVLSGFLIVTLLLREKDATDTISLKKFYARRSLRIFPLFYAILAVMAIYVYWSDSQSIVVESIRENLIHNLTYTSNWLGAGALLSVAWSLAAEEQFYFVWPPIQRFFGRAVLPILVALIGLNQLFNFGVLLGDHQPDLEILQVTFTPILFGVGLAYLLHHHYEIMAAFVGHRLASPILAVVLLIVAGLPNDSGSLVGVHRLVIHFLMVALVASVVVVEDHALAKTMTIRPLVRIGAISYGIYLLHMFVRHVAVSVIERAGVDTVPLILFAVTFVGVVLAAEISFRWFESPLLRLKRHYATAPASPTTSNQTVPVTFPREASPTLVNSFAEPRVRLADRLRRH